MSDQGNELSNEEFVIEILTDSIYKSLALDLFQNLLISSNLSSIPITNDDITKKAGERVFNFEFDKLRMILTMNNISSDKQDKIIKQISENIISNIDKISSKVYELVFD